MSEKDTAIHQVYLEGCGGLVRHLSLYRVVVYCVALNCRFCNRHLGGAYSVLGIVPVLYKYSISSFNLLSLASLGSSIFLHVRKQVFWTSS